MKKNKVKILKIFLVVLIAIWAYVVFNFSSQNGGDSSGLSRKVVELFTKNEDTINIVEPYVRKAAHFSEYALGGVLFISLFSTYKWPEGNQITISILLGIWYAITDEVHQLMVPGRHGAVFDVYLDTLGFSTGVLAMLLLIKIVKLCRKNNSKTRMEEKSNDRF